MYVALLLARFQYREVIPPPYPPTWGFYYSLMIPGNWAMSCLFDEPESLDILVPNNKALLHASVRRCNPKV